MRQIPDSELILDNDGRIYHLHLRPEEIASTILTVGDPARVERISRYFDRVEIKREKREFVTHTGWYQGKRLTVVSTGIGPDNIDIAMNELDALVNIDFSTRQVKDTHTPLNFIRVGTSGCLQPDIPVDSLLVSAFGIGLDNLMSFYECHPNLSEATLYDEWRQFQEYTGRLPVESYVVQAHHRLYEYVSAGLRTGITFTAPGFYGPQGRTLRAKARFTPELLQQIQHFTYQDLRITNFEMETSAIYGLAKVLGHRAVSCNAIIANRANGTFSKDANATIERLIAIVLKKVAEMPED